MSGTSHLGQSAGSRKNRFGLPFAGVHGLWSAHESLSPITPRTRTHRRTVSCSDDDAPAFNYDRDLQIDGLSAPVGAHFDEYGVLHLECQTDEDCFAAEGYFHASHRLFQMELRRRLTQGRLSEVAGPAALAFDQNYRSLIATPDGGDLLQQLWDNASEPTRRALEAYSRGVSAFIADWRAGRNGATVSPEFELGFSIPA